MCVLNPKSFHWTKFQSNNFALLYFKGATGGKGGFLFLTPAVGTRSDNTYSLYDFLFPVLLPQRKTFNFMVSSPNSNIPHMPNKPQNNYLSIPADRSITVIKPGNWNHDMTQTSGHTVSVQFTIYLHFLLLPQIRKQDPFLTLTSSRKTITT